MNVANCDPSIVSTTEVARLAVHFSSISVGALQEIGELGLTVKSVIRTLLDEPVAVVGGLVVVVVDDAVDDVVDAVALVVEPVELVVGVPLLCPLLQAPSTKTARTATASAAVRPIRGG